MKKLLLFIAVATLVSCNSSAQTQEEERTFEVTKTESEWKAALDNEEFYVLREAGTERPWSSPLNKNYDPGTYSCAGCDTVLYESEHKFDSGTGWPSWDQAVKGAVITDTDYKLGYARTELLCGTCGGHLGHLFNDGPRETTGMRHCINGVALEFTPQQ